MMDRIHVGYSEDTWEWLPEREQLRHGWLGTDQVYDAELIDKEHAVARLHDDAAHLEQAATKLRQLAVVIKGDAEWIENSKPNLAGDQPCD